MTTRELLLTLANIAMVAGASAILIALLALGYPPQGCRERCLTGDPITDIQAR